MAEIPRLNGAISALEQGKPAFTAFAAPEVDTAQAIGAASYDAAVFEIEHNPYDIKALRHCMQYMLDRRQILKSGSLAPAVTPFVRIPPNGSEMNQWMAKQVLDIGVYGVIWPHVSTVEEARNAVAACRYPRPSRRRISSRPGSAAMVRRGRPAIGASRSRNTTSAPTSGRSIRRERSWSASCARKCARSRTCRKC